LPQALTGAVSKHNETIKGQLVAFSDPNNLLSYQVAEHIMVEAGTGVAAADVTIK
jgi:hypothetical protein